MKTESKFNSNLILKKIDKIIIDDVYKLFRDNK